MWYCLLAFLSAFVASSVLAPIVAKAAMHFELVDRPDGRRKLHQIAVPLTGGPTVFLSGVIGILVTLAFFPNLLASTAHDIKFLTALTASGLLIVVIGILDDRFGMRGRQKLAGQIVAAMIMVPSGIVIRHASIFGYHVSFGDFGPIITLLAIVGAINALNLIDGVDGLASTTGIVLSLSIAAVTYLYGARADGLLLSLVLAGALSGFLIYNFPPARMFLGDSGSMLIGLVLGSLALKCSIKQFAATTLILPTAIWAIPMFDVSMAIIRRKLTGRSIYETDRGHLHHCLQRKGFSGARLLFLTTFLCSLTGIGAVLGSWFKNDLIAVTGVVTALLLLILTRTFGHTEVSLVKNRMQRFTGSMMRRRAPMQTVMHNQEVRLNGQHDWEALWVTLTDFAQRFEMDSVELMVHLPNIDEEYHASWKSKTNTESHETWRSEIPLVINQVSVGQLKVQGAVGEESICKWMGDLIGGLEAFEQELVTLVEELNPAPPAVQQPIMPSGISEPAAAL